MIIAMDKSIDHPTALGYRRMACMNDMLCSRSVASLASAERLPKFSTAMEALRTTVSAGWRALESVSTFEMTEWLCMVKMEAGEALRDGWWLGLRHGGCFGVYISIFDKW